MGFVCVSVCLFVVALVLYLFCFSRERFEVEGGTGRSWERGKNISKIHFIKKLNNYRKAQRKKIIYKSHYGEIRFPTFVIYPPSSVGLSKN